MTVIMTIDKTVELLGSGWLDREGRKGTSLTRGQTHLEVVFPG